MICFNMGNLAIRKNMLPIEQKLNFDCILT